ncbi:hypothetical protein H8L32_12570 [Undibacterium sp. CY18W]|uniref:Uncharacterized protein n=1 Tax=Undibacterium hunanense TaxID=2762292 RepID=A0ABR6ZR27_9BURK|nr:hypothetical protein [Undibacterium hunanense]MBC3918317.1 hypothetical protein [Undibacterium hunanense]
MKPYLISSVVLMMSISLHGNVYAMTVNEAYNNLIFFQAAANEGDYCENKLNIQALPALKKWQRQNDPVLKRTVNTIEQHLMTDKGLSKPEVKLAMVEVWKKMDDIDKRRLAERRTHKTCMQFTQSLKFYESRLTQ